MKYQQFFILSAALLLAACASIDANYGNKDRLADVKQVCIRNKHTDRLPELAKSLADSFRKYGISSRIVSDFKAPSCHFVVQAEVKARGNLIHRGKVVLAEKVGEAGRTKRLSAVAYMRRGEEKQRAETVGLRGQTDEIVRQLLNK